MSTASPGREGWAWLGVALALLALSLMVQLHHMADWYGRGGSPWAQADWLINLAAGPIRRGPFGEALLWLAGTSGIAVLDLLMGLQLGLTLALYGLTAVLLWRQPDPAAAALAVFSAAFFAVLIGAAPSSGLRKELLALVALLLVAVPGGGLGRVVLSAALLAACAVGHELGVLFLPAWAIALALLRPEALAGWPGQAVLAALVLAVAAAAAYALRFPHLDDAAPVCAAIRAAGPVSAQFCDGAVAWMADPEGGSTRVREALAAVGAQLWPSLAGMAAAFGPLVMLARLTRAPRRIVLALVASTAPFLLLFPLGFDWGRWVALQYTVAAVLMLGLMAHGLMLPATPGTGWLALWLVVAMATGITLFITPMPFAFPLMVWFVIASWV
jgi:hypothetical protein